MLGLCLEGNKVQMSLGGSSPNPPPMKLWSSPGRMQYSLSYFVSPSTFVLNLPWLSETIWTGFKNIIIQVLQSRSRDFVSVFTVNG